MSEMVERVAKALWAVSAEPENGDSWEALSEDWRDNFRTHSRTAIEAMREPTSAMAAKACNALKRHIDSLSEEERETRWPGRKDDKGWRVPNKEKHKVRYQAMIDAALPHPAELSKGAM
jgi:hypothetical protein